MFAQQSEYRLNNHGQHTTVSRVRYIAVGAGSVVAWHMGVAAMAVFGLNLALFGERLQFSDPS